jgi:hypothetical protein
LTPALARQGKGRALAEGDWWQLRKQGGIPLPDITLSGPLELLLPRPYPLTAYLPHPADVGEASRIVLAPGAIATIRGLKALALRYLHGVPAAARKLPMCCTSPRKERPGKQRRDPHTNSHVCRTMRRLLRRMLPSHAVLCLVPEQASEHVGTGMVAGGVRMPR